MSTITIFYGTYDGERLNDLERDISEALCESPFIETDDHGFVIGQLRVTIEYEKE